MENLAFVAENLCWKIGGRKITLLWPGFVVEGWWYRGRQAQVQFNWDLQIILTESAPRPIQSFSHNVRLLSVPLAERAANLQEVLP